MRKCVAGFIALCTIVIAPLACAQQETCLRRAEASDPILQSVMPEVPIAEIGSSEVQGIIDQMISVAKGEGADRETPLLVGLAAPQVGIRQQIILVDIGITPEKKNLGDLRAYINPTILWSSQEMEEGREGCFSVGDNLVGIVPRAKKIIVRAYDRSGSPVEEEWTGLIARIFQHEIDHLFGICFPDRIGPNGALHWVEKNQYQEYREHWQQWRVLCPWSVWLAIKKGIPFDPPHYSSYAAWSLSFPT